MAIDWWLTAKQRKYTEGPHEMFMHLYVTNENGMYDLAREFDVSVAAIRRALIRFEIPIRPHGGPRVKARRN